MRCITGTLSLEELLKISATQKAMGTVGAGTNGILIEFLVTLLTRSLNLLPIDAIQNVCCQAYNPTTETIASVEFELVADITGHWKAYLYVNAIPRVIYPTHNSLQFGFQILMEGIFAVMWSLLAISFFRGMLRSWHHSLPDCVQSCIGASGFFTPAFLAAPEYEHSPGDWRVFYMTATIMHCLIVADAVVWVLLNYYSFKLHQLAVLHHNSLDNVLEDQFQAGNLNFIEFASSYSDALKEILTVA